jgi:NADH:ubiquinone oxidoreductase subunit 3 (subunit A)
MIAINKILTAIIDLTWPAKLLALVLSFIAPLASLIYVIIFLLVVDAITSIYYQMKTAAGTGKTNREKWRLSVAIIESNKLRRTLEKMFFYIIMILVFYSFDVYVIKVKPISMNEIHTFSITNLSAVMIALVELTSIASNVSKITNNDIFDKIVSLFKKKVDKKFEIDNENE